VRNGLLFSTTTDHDGGVLRFFIDLRIAEFHTVESHFAEFHNVERHFAEFHFADPI
jgi:hypothetical protein